MERSYKFGGLRRKNDNLLNKKRSAGRVPIYAQISELLPSEMNLSAKKIVTPDFDTAARCPFVVIVPNRTGERMLPRPVKKGFTH